MVAGGRREAPAEEERATQQHQEEEEEEEEEERLPRSHGRWALASSPGGPAQTSHGSPPSYLRKSNSPGRWVLRQNNTPSHKHESTQTKANP